MSCGSGKASATRSRALPDSKLLLDSHAFVWALTKPDKLPRASREAIDDLSRVILVSTASIWEIAAKVGRGRWPEADPVIEDVEGVLRRAGMTPLLVSVTHARAAGTLEWDHRDPFDRMLAAQAIAEGAILVTADRAFAALAGLAVLWN